MGRFLAQAATRGECPPLWPAASLRCPYRMGSIQVATTVRHAGEEYFFWDNQTFMNQIGLGK